MTANRHNVLVLGAGINGLSSAVRIQEMCPNVDVTIMAEQFSSETTSDGAAGFWEVFACAKEDEELTSILSRETFDHIKELAMSSLGGPITGTFKLSGFQTADKPIQGEFVFKDVVEGYRQMSPEEIAQFRDDRVKDGRYFTSLCCEPRFYMKWLTNRFIGNGGQLIKQKINSLQELSEEWEVVVNCTGLGSYHLLQDHEMYPIRGQVFRVQAPWIKTFCILEQVAKIGEESLPDTTYIFPNLNEVVVGGTFQKGDWSTECNEEDAKMIWDKAVKLVPSLKHAKIVKSWAGLRPGRYRLRLEPELINIGQNRKIRMVHNYGHCGAGLSMFHGCARVVAEMVSDFIQDMEHNAIHLTKSKL